MTEINLQPGEKIIRQGYAANYHSVIAHTGRLFLTNQRLYFTTDKLNYKQYDITILLNDIEDIVLKNNLRIFSHGILVIQKNGHKPRFSIWKRKKWQKKILQLIEQKKAT